MSPALRMPPAARPFVRFVVGPDSEPAHILDGIFQTSAVPDVFRHASGQVHAAIATEFEWFNAHLIVPPLLKGSATRPLACWFRSDAGEMVVRIWRLARQICDAGYAVRYVWTNHPGPIVYYDEHQIVARRPVPGRRRDCYWELTL